MKTIKSLFFLLLILGYTKNSCASEVSNESISNDNSFDASCCFPGNFTYTENGCSACFSISTNCATSATDIIWDFGDGQSGSGENVCHTFIQSGSYVVTMIACSKSDPTDCKSVEHEIMISCPCDLPCGITPVFLVEEFAPCSYYLIDYSVPAPGYTITGWNWTLDTLGTSTDSIAIFLPTQIGEYNVCLTVTASNGVTECTDEFCWPIVCSCGPNICPNVADFEVKDQVSTVDFAFFGKANLAPGCEVVDWHWDFGDGTTDNIQEPHHTYLHEGFYTVCLTVTLLCDGVICQDTQCKVIGCHCPPAISFSYSQIGPCQYEFTFPEFDQCYTNINGHWNFNGGADVIGNNVIQTFEQGGLIQVCLELVITYNGGTCEKLYCENVNINCTQAMPLLDNGNGNNLKVVPNPTTGKFKVSINSEIEQPILINITNNVGTSVLQKKISAIKGTNTVELDLENVAPGIYSVTTTFTNHSKVSTQLVLEK
jgi:hypothetical protein